RLEAARRHHHNTSGHPTARCAQSSWSSLRFKRTATVIIMTVAMARCDHDDVPCPARTQRKQEIRSMGKKPGSRGIRLAGTPDHHPNAEAQELDLGMDPDAAGGAQVPGYVAPGAPANHPIPTASVIMMTRIDLVRLRLDVAVERIQAPLPDVAGHVLN